MRAAAQFSWHYLVSIVLFCLLVHPTCVVSKSVFSIDIRWPTISINEVIHHRIPSQSESHGDHDVSLSPELEQGYHEWNEERLRELVGCLGVVAGKRCRPNQSNVVLVNVRWFEDQLVEEDWKGVVRRQGVSAYKHLQQMGYTALFSKNFEEALDQYRMFPDLVKLVIHDNAIECYANPDCVQGPSNPGGIPAWKIFDFESFITQFQDIMQD